MSLTYRHRSPRMIQRGQTVSLSCDVFDASSAQQTATAATFTLLSGSKTVVDAAAASSLGPPASYTLADSITASESLSDRWLERWAQTIGGTVHTFERQAFLVRNALRPVITDTDLTDLHSDLADLRDDDQTSFEAQRGAAFDWVQGRLIQKGNRPQLILNEWQLAECHRARTLEIIFNDFAASINANQRYRELADYYRELAKTEFDSLQLVYDFDEDGKIDEGDHRSGSPVTFLSAPWGASY